MTVTLRHWRPDDEALVAEGAENDYTALIEGLARPGWLAEHVADPWARVIELDAEPVGGIGATRRHVPGLAEIGYWVVPRSRSKGAATEATRRLSRWLFDETDLERLQATVEPWNAASQRVLEKSGYLREGLLRGYASWGSVRRDVYLYAKLAGDD